MGLLDFQDCKATWELWDSEEILENQGKKVLLVRLKPVQEIRARKERKVYLETPDLKV